MFLQSHWLSQRLGLVTIGLKACPIEREMTLPFTWRQRSPRLVLPAPRSTLAARATHFVEEIVLRRQDEHIQLALARLLRLPTLV